MPQVQSYPIFHLVKGMTEKQSGGLEDALASMKTAKDFITTKKLPGSVIVPSAFFLYCEECILGFQSCMLEMGLGMRRLIFVW